jgi:thiol-disulfide isomerase/thioredoxin
MKSFVVLSVMLLIAIGGYAYSKNPTGCAKIGTDFVALFYSLLPNSPTPAQDTASSSPTSTTNAAPAPTSPVPAPIVAAPPHPAPVAAATNLPPTPPAPVTPTPAAAPVATAPTPTPPPPAAPANEWTTDYPAALAQAKASNKLVLLNFTGSDWCGQPIETEVFSQPSFKTFAAQNYVLVTLDFPQQAVLPAALKQQNQALALQFHISGYPTLIVVDPQGKELGRSTGYTAGTGPDLVIAQLKTFNKS